MLWLNFLHLYQPANNLGYTVKEATDESYLRILSILEKNPGLKFTFNITGCLFLRWAELGYGEIPKRIAALHKKNQLEITGTAAYHPILPLIPEKEAARQIKENELILKKYLTFPWKKRGFFLPEMAYSPAVAKLIKKLGYSWLILDEIAFNGRLGEADISRIYRDEYSGLNIALRSRELSNSYVPETIAKLIDKKTESSRAELPVVITATDGELYGLRHKDKKNILENLSRRGGFYTRLLSDYIARAGKFTPLKPKPHSWQTSETEYQKNEPFNLWRKKTNTLQRKLWQLADLSYGAVEERPRDKNYCYARWHLVRGLASCTFWWASAKDFRLFGPISWGPDEIERGATDLMRALRSLDDESARNTKLEGEKLLNAISRIIWQKHWAYYWKKT